MVVVGGVMLGHYGNMLPLFGRGRIAIHWGLDYPLLLEELPEANILAYSTGTVIAEN